LTERRGAAVELSEAQTLAFYEWMLTGRILEGALLEAGDAGRGGFLYPGSGQEAAQVGLASALDPGDVFAGSHRDLLARLVRGVTLEEALLDLFGKAAGPGRGRRAYGAPVLAKGVLGTSGPSAEGMAVAVGAALAFHCRGEGRVVMALCGEGAAAAGTWHEAVNVAAVLGLPVVFAVENNQFAGALPNAAVAHLAYTAHRADGYGLPGIVVDGNDVLEVYAVAREAVERARAGEGPSLIEAVTFRQQGHDVFDSADYVDPETRRTWLDRDPIPRFEEHLGSRGLLDETRRAHLEQKARTRVARTIEWARQQADTPPDDSPVAIWPVGLEASPESGTPASFGQAVAQTLDEEMRRDPAVVVLGCDVGRRGGAHGITRGLLERYGPRRVVDLPTSGPGLMGVAVGAALCGLRPVVEVPAERLPESLGLLRGHAVSGEGPAPLAVRVPMRPGGEGLDGVVGLPGLVVMAPSTAAAARSLLQAAVRHPGPVVFLEPVSLYPTEDGPGGSRTPLPGGKARLARPGDGVTVVAWGEAVAAALAAAEEAAAGGVSAEVIDLQCLAPLDLAAVVASVARTGRLVVADGGPSGVGAEVAARVAGEGFWHLDGPVLRVAPAVVGANAEGLTGPHPAEILAAVLSLTNT
jgi:2-oxoisovalerate dehydrogenase E1 component